MESLDEGVLYACAEHAHEIYTQRCSSCDKDSAYLRCAGCSGIFYCSKQCQKKHWKRHRGSCTFFLSVVLITSDEVYSGDVHSWWTVSWLRNVLAHRLDIRSKYVELMHKSKIIDRFNDHKKRLWDYITDGRCELTVVKTPSLRRPRPLNYELESDGSMPSLTSSSDE